MSVRILIGDCRERLRELPDGSVDSAVTDPPYELGFMGRGWDKTGVANDNSMWAEVLRVLKPGGHLVAFSGTRTYHRMAVAIEDAGFDVRDQLAWVYGSGFPKSLDVSKAIDKMAGAKREVIGKGKRSQNRSAGWDRPWMREQMQELGGSGMAEHDITAPATEAAQQWQGWGTALKPSWEPICLARKPLIGPVAQNVLTHGTGALDIDGCRIEGGESTKRPMGKLTSKGLPGGSFGAPERRGDRPIVGKSGSDLGRWPANLCHDGSEEVLAEFPAEARSSGEYNRTMRDAAKTDNVYGEFAGDSPVMYADSGSAARFFYCAKATTEERGEGNNHPTVKPIALMQWLVRLVTPKGGTVLDPFSGSGSTLLAADMEGLHAIGCELSHEYAAIAERRLRDSAGMFADVRVAA